MSSDLRALVDAVRYTRGRAECDCDCDDKQAMRAAERRLIDALLTSRAVEAVEAVVALGKARAWARTNAVDEKLPMTSGMADALRGRSDALAAVLKLADALAEEVG